MTIIWSHVFWYPRTHVPYQYHLMAHSHPNTYINACALCFIFRNTMCWLALYTRCVCFGLHWFALHCIVFMHICVHLNALRCAEKNKYILYLFLQCWENATQWACVNCIYGDHLFFWLSFTGNTLTNVPLGIWYKLTLIVLIVHFDWPPCIFQWSHKKELNNKKTGQKPLEFSFCGQVLG